MILDRQFSLVPAGPHSLSPESRISTRNTLGSRNRPNSPDINNLNFSSRNKMRGVAGQKSEDITKISPKKSTPYAAPNARLALGLKCSAAALSAASANLQFVAEPVHRGGPSSFQPQASSLQNLIATRANRNHPNSPNINETCSSNRNKMRGGSGPKLARINKAKRGNPKRRTTQAPEQGFH